MSCTTREAPKSLSGADLAGFLCIYYLILYGLMVSLRSFMFLVRILSSSGLQPKRMLFTSERLSSFVTSKLSTSRYETLMNGNSAGAFFETFVVSEILKSYYNCGKEPSIQEYYWERYRKQHKK